MPATYRLDPSTVTYPGSTSYPGLVDATPYLRAFIDLSGSPSGAPNWSALTDSDLRVFNIIRGRESELTEFDAGTATLTVDNRDRAFDPANASSPYYPYIRPMTRFYLQAELGGVLYDLFKGYAKSYDQNWPEGFDATCTINLVDEFQVLSLATLPTTNPPRDNYEDVVLFDNPQGYWTMKAPAGVGVVSPSAGGISLSFDEAIAIANGASWSNSNNSNQPIVGDADGSSFWLLPFGGSGITPLSTGTLNSGDPGDAGGLSEMGIELWYNTNAYPGTTIDIIRGPDAASAGAYTWKLQLNPAGTVTWTVKDAGGSTFTATSTGPIPLNSWTHLFGNLVGGVAQLFFNGVLAAGFGGWGSSFSYAIQSSFDNMRVGNYGGLEQQRYSHIAFYRYGLSSTRIVAHYQAGALRGFANQDSGVRIGAVLDAAGSTAARTLATGTRTILARRQRGQPPLDEIRSAVEGEAVDSAFFAAKDGSLVFLPTARASSGTAYSSTQATFGDAAGELAYVDAAIDNSDAFLNNSVDVTRENGTTQSASDSTSIGKYFKRSLSLTGLPVTTDADCTAIAAALLAKYKDPMTRITDVTLSTADPTVAAAALSRDLLHKIRVLRTPPGGGARLDQTLWIQKIEIAGDNSQVPWTIRWAVSPL